MEAEEWLPQRRHHPHHHHLQTKVVPCHPCLSFHWVWRLMKFYEAEEIKEREATLILLSVAETQIYRLLLYEDSKWLSMFLLNVFLSFLLLVISVCREEKSSVKLNNKSFSHHCHVLSRLTPLSSLPQNTLLVGRRFSLLLKKKSRNNLRKAAEFTFYQEKSAIAVNLDPLRGLRETDLEERESK